MFDPTTFTDEELLDGYLGAEVERRVLDGRVARLAVELERRGTCDTEFGSGTGSWLAARTDLPVGKCRYRVKVAVKLTVHLPKVPQALEAGLISWDHVEVIYEAANPRIVEQVALLQDALIADAQGQTFTRWKLMVRRVALQLDVDGGFDPDRDRPDRLHLSSGFDGDTQLSGSFSGAGSLTAVTELERVTDELFHQAQKDFKACPELGVPSRSELRAKALVEICRRSAARDLDDSTPPRAEIIVLLNADTGAAGTPDGVPVMPATLTGLLPVSVWRAMWLDQHRVPLDLGRTHRYLTAHQRSALMVRDGGCVWPGCDARTNWTDGHHTTTWDDGGPTDLHLLGLLCRHHHGVVHRKGWSMRPEGDGYFTITTHTGRAMQTQRHGRQKDRTSDQTQPDRTGQLPDRKPRAA